MATTSTQYPIPTLMTTAEPYFFRGSSTGVLVLHGITASPAETRWLGVYLAEQGYTVYGARHPGHGSTPEDLDRLRWRDWYLNALDGVQILRQQCARVVVVGHSMGGLLALLLGAAGQVDAVATLAAPVRLQNRLMPYARWIKYGMRYSDRPDTSHMPQLLRDEQHKRGEPVVGRVHYARWATAAIAELYDLMQVAFAQVPQIACPLLLVYSRTDETVPYDNMQLLVQAAAQAQVQTVTLDNSHHVLIQDGERDMVFAAVAAFIAQQTGSQHAESEPPGHNARIE